MALPIERRRSTDEEHAEILAILSDIRTQLAERKHYDDKVTALDKCINGNGTPGLKTEMQLVKDQLQRFNWAAGILVAAVLGDIASRILAK